MGQIVQSNSFSLGSDIEVSRSLLLRLCTSRLFLQRSELQARGNAVHVRSLPSVHTPSLSSCASCAACQPDPVSQAPSNPPFQNPRTPLAGHYYNRIWVISAGCVLWGVMTAAFTACTSVRGGMVVWAVNGVGLALVIPCSQSLTADYYEPGARGRAFGVLYLTAALGGMLGSLWATNIGACGCRLS